MLDIIMARRQDDNERRDKRTTFFWRTGQWGSGSTGKQAKNYKKHKKRPGQLQLYIYVLKNEWICFLLFFFSFYFAR